MTVTTTVVHLRILEVWVDAERQVAGQRPGRGRPRHQLCVVRVVVQHESYLNIRRTSRSVPGTELQPGQGLSSGTGRH